MDYGIKEQIFTLAKNLKEFALNTVRLKSWILQDLAIFKLASLARIFAFQREVSRCKVSLYSLLLNMN